MEKLDILNFRSIALTAFHPIMPLFINTWRNFSYSKWLGIAAKVTYNSNFRNGWVIIDTTIKGTAGTPLLEFSCWESHESRYNIVVPRMMTYKYFFRDKNWRANFIARSSVSQSELWSSRSITYSFLLNGYNHNFFLRNANYLYLLKSIRLLLFTANILWDYRVFHYSAFFDLLFSQQTYFLNVRGALKNKRKRARFMTRIYALRREHLNFLLFDRFFVSGSTNKNFFLNNGYNFFKNVFMRFFNTTFLKFSSNKKISSNILSFSVDNRLAAKTINFKIFLLVAIFYEMRTNLVLDLFYTVLAQSLSKDLAFVFLKRSGALSRQFNPIGPLTLEGLFKNFFSLFLRKILTISNISLLSKMKLLMGGILQFSESFFGNECNSNFFESNYTHTVNLLLKTYSYKFKSFSLSNLYFLKPKLVNNYFGPNTISLKEFLRYNIRIRRTRRVAYVPRTVFNMPKYPWNRWFRARRRRLQRLRRKQNRLLNKNKLRVKRPWRYICNWSKMALTERRQSVFLIFWALNFFNFNNITTPPKVTKDTFYVAIRLVRFFKKFFIFFRFYSFYLNLLRVSIKSNTRFTIFKDLVTAGSFKTFLFVLGKRFRKLLIFFRFYIIYLVIKAEKGWSSALLTNVLVKESFFSSLKFLNFPSLDRLKDFRLDFNKLNFFSKKERFVSESSNFPTFLVYKYINFLKLKNLVNFNYFSINRSSMYLSFLLKTRTKFNILLLRKFSEGILKRPFVGFNEADEEQFPLLNFKDMVNTWKSAVNRFVVVRWHKNNFRRPLTFYKAKELFTTIITYTVEFFLPGLIIDREFKFRKMLYNLFGKYLLSKRTVPVAFNNKQLNRFCTSILEYFILDELKESWVPATKKWFFYILGLVRKFANYKHSYAFLSRKNKVPISRSSKVSNSNFPQRSNFFSSLASLKFPSSLSSFTVLFKKFANRLDSKILRTFFYSYLRKHKLNLVYRNKYRSRALKFVSSLLNLKGDQSEKIDYAVRKRFVSFNFFYRDFKFNSFVSKELVPFRHLATCTFTWNAHSRWETITKARAFLSGYSFVHDKLLVLNTIYPLIRKRYFTPNKDQYLSFSDLSVYSFEYERSKEKFKYFRLTSFLKTSMYFQGSSPLKTRALAIFDTFPYRTIADLAWYRSFKHPVAIMQFTFVDFSLSDFWYRILFTAFNNSLNSLDSNSSTISKSKLVSVPFFNYLNLVGYSAQTVAGLDEFVDSKRCMTELLNYFFILEQPSYVELFSATLFDLEELVVYFYELGVRYYTHLRMYVFDNIVKIYVKFFLANLRSFRKRIVSYDSRNAALDNIIFNQSILRQYITSSSQQLYSLLNLNFIKTLLLPKLVGLNEPLLHNNNLKHTDLLNLNNLVDLSIFSQHLNFFNNFSLFLFLSISSIKYQNNTDLVRKPLIFLQKSDNTNINKTRRLTRLRKIRGYLHSLRDIISVILFSVQLKPFSNFSIINRNLKNFYRSCAISANSTAIYSIKGDLPIAPNNLAVTHSNYVADYAKKYLRLFSNRLTNLDSSDSSILNILFKYWARFSKDTRAVTPLMFEVYARKRGLYKKPKWWEVKKKRPSNQPKYMSDAYYKRFILGEDDTKKKGPRKWKPRVIDYGGGSIFSRTNMASMLLKFDFPEVRFRFAKLFYSWRIRKIKKYFVAKLFYNFAKLGLSTRKLSALMGKVRKICFLKAKNKFLKNRLRLNSASITTTPSNLSFPTLPLNSMSLIRSIPGKRNKSGGYLNSSSHIKNNPLFGLFNSSNNLTRASYPLLFNSKSRTAFIDRKHHYALLSEKVLKFLGFSARRVLSDDVLSSSLNNLIYSLNLLCKKRGRAKFHLKWKDSRSLIKHFFALFSLTSYKSFYHNTKLYKFVLQVVALLFRTWSNFLSKRRLPYSSAFFYNLMFFRWMRSKVYKFFSLISTKKPLSTVEEFIPLTLDTNDLLKNFKLSFISPVLKKRRYNKLGRLLTINNKRSKWTRLSIARKKLLLKKNKNYKLQSQNFTNNTKAPIFLGRKRVGSASALINKKTFRRKLKSHKFVWHSLRSRDFTPHYDKKGVLSFRPNKSLLKDPNSSRLKLFRLKKSVLAGNRKTHPELYINNISRRRKLITALKFFFNNKKNKWFIRYVGFLKSAKNKDLSKLWHLLGTKRRIKLRLNRIRKFKKTTQRVTTKNLIVDRTTDWIDYSFLIRQVKSSFNFRRANFLFRKFNAILRKRPQVFNNYVFGNNNASTEFLRTSVKLPSILYKFDHLRLSNFASFSGELNSTSDSHVTLSTNLYSKLLKKREFLLRGKNLLKYSWWLKRRRMDISSYISLIKRKRKRNWFRKQLAEERFIRYEIATKTARLKKLKRQRFVDRRGLKKWGDKWFPAKEAALANSRRIREAKRLALKARMDHNFWFRRQLRALNPSFDYTKAFVKDSRNAILKIHKRKAVRVPSPLLKAKFATSKPPFREFRRSTTLLRKIHRKRSFRKKTSWFFKKPFKAYYGRWLSKMRRFVQGLSRLLFKTLVSALLRLVYVYKFQRIIYTKQFLNFPTINIFSGAVLRKHNSFLVYNVFIKKFLSALYDKLNRVSSINKSFFLKNSKVAFIFSFIFNFFKKFTVSYFNFSVFYHFSEDFFRSMLKIFFDKIVLYFTQDMLVLSKEDAFGFTKNFFILNKLLKRNLYDFSSSRINYFALGRTKININLNSFPGHSLLNSLFLVWDLRISKIFLNGTLFEFFSKLNLMDAFNSRGYLFRLRRFKVLTSVKKNRFKGILLREMAYKYPLYSDNSSSTSEKLKSIYFSLKGLAKLPDSVRGTAKDFPRFGFYWYRVKEWRTWIRRRNKSFLKFFLLYLMRTKLRNNEVPHHVNYGKMPKYPVKNSKNWFFFYKVHESILKVR